MDEDYDKKVTSAAEVFELLGFDIETAEDGAITLIGYDNKTGQEDLFIQEVADLADTGWYLVWRGEDGDVWRQSALGVEQGRVVFG